MMDSRKVVRLPTPPTTDPPVAEVVQLRKQNEELTVRVQNAELHTDVAKSGLAHAIAAYKILEASVGDGNADKTRASQMMDCVTARYQEAKLEGKLNVIDSQAFILSQLTAEETSRYRTKALRMEDTEFSVDAACSD